MQVELGDQLGIIQTDTGDEDLGGTKCLLFMVVWGEKQTTVKTRQRTSVS